MDQNSETEKEILDRQPDWWKLLRKNLSCTSYIDCNPKEVGDVKIEIPKKKR